jgi:uncharacterized protein
MLLKKFPNFVVQHRKQIGKIAIGSFATINLLAFLGVYVMTHTHRVGEIGLSLPRPTSPKLPSDFGLQYTTDRIPIDRDEWLETWSIPAAAKTKKGTIILFPGHWTSKGKELISLAKVFHQLDYDCLLVDYRGIGGSSGDTNTIGIKEARDVAIAMQYIRQKDRQHPIILYGLSMGSAAILTAIAKENIQPDAIVLELPYARLIDAIGIRLRYRNIPTFPMSELLVFWGGIQHGSNGFAHNPVDFASQVKCPTLILNGRKDKWTSQTEIEEIFNNVPVSKQLVTFDRAGHDLLISIDRQLWEGSIKNFLDPVSAAKLSR